MSSRMRTTSMLGGSNPQQRTHNKKPHTPLELELQWNTLLGQQDLLREEIRRGEQYLEQAQAGVAEAGSLLEEWPSYEKSCGRNCLPCLTETALAGRRIERFLTNWLKRRRSQLRSVEQAIGDFAREYRLPELR